MTMNENRRRGASFLYYLTDMISPSFIDTALLRARSAECTIRSVYEMALWIVESPFSVAVYHQTACLFYDEYRYYSVEVLRRTRCVEPQETRDILGTNTAIPVHQQYYSTSTYLH